MKKWDIIIRNNTLKELSTQFNKNRKRILINVVGKNAI